MFRWMPAQWSGSWMPIWVEIIDPQSPPWAT